MSVEDIRRRLEQLNRGPLPAVQPLATTHAGVLAATAIGEHVQPTSLADLVAGEVIVNGDGSYYRISRRISQCWKAMADVSNRLAGSVRTTRPTNGHDPDLTLLTGIDPAHLLLLDLETCGFSGTPLFLIGLMYLEEGELICEQLLARNYEEERAILCRLGEVGRDRRILVTFNGKAFDWPFVQDRAAVSRTLLCQPAGHVDLLHAARRRYRQVLPDCRLQTLEVFLCNRKRVGDIPGSQIPEAYNQFVRTGDARQLREIVHHNFLDLTTMAELLAVMLEADGGILAAPTLRTPEC